MNATLITWFGKVHSLLYKNSTLQIIK